jgi:hypothetical protein
MAALTTCGKLSACALAASAGTIPARIKTPSASPLCKSAANGHCQPLHLALSSHCDEMTLLSTRPSWSSTAAAVSSQLQAPYTSESLRAASPTEMHCRGPSVPGLDAQQVRGLAPRGRPQQAPAAGQPQQHIENGVTHACVCTIHKGKVLRFFPARIVRLEHVVSRGRRTPEEAQELSRRWL